MCVCLYCEVVVCCYDKGSFLMIFMSTGKIVCICVGKIENRHSFLTSHSQHLNHLPNRVTSMDSGGSGNGSNHLLNTDLSVANSSINMWNVSTFFALIYCIMYHMSYTLPRDLCPTS